MKNKNRYKNIYVCYSIPLRNFLYKNGIKYEVCGINPQSKKMFWCFCKNKELNKYLNIWTNNYNV